MFFPRRKKMRSYWPQRKWTKPVHWLLHLGSHQAPDKSLKIIQQMCQMAQNDWHKFWDSSILVRPELLNVRYCQSNFCGSIVSRSPYQYPNTSRLHALQHTLLPLHLLAFHFGKCTGNVEVLSILGIIYVEQWPKTKEFHYSFAAKTKFWDLPLPTLGVFEFFRKIMMEIPRDYHGTPSHSGTPVPQLRINKLVFPQIYVSNKKQIPKTQQISQQKWPVSGESMRISRHISTTDSFSPSRSSG